MPFSNTKFARSSLLMLLVGAAVLAAIVTASFILSRMTQSYFNDVVKLRDLRSASSDMMLYLRAAESGQRGYVLTRDNAFLTPYTAATEGMNRQRERLRKSYASQSVVTFPLDQFEALLDKKLEEMKSTVDLARDGQFDAAADIVRNSSGREIMDQMSAQLVTMVRDLDRRLNSGIQDLRDTADALQWFTLGGGIVIMLVVGGAIVVVAQHVRELSRAHRAVEELNTGLEERVTERTEDLIQANREIQRYAYIVSHDLRAPLVNIMGFTSELDQTLKSIRAYVLAGDRPPSEEDIRQARLAVEEDLPEAIGFIRSSTKKMDGLINAILKISRDGRRELKPEPVDLKDLMEATANSINHQVTEGGGAVTIALGGASRLITDRFSLEQIFGNLFDNAVKYKHPDRALSLTVRAQPAGRGMLRIEVTDNGRGIAPEDHERIFELFRRSGLQDSPGEGIGLAHVRSLVRNLGGEITVQSTLGSGSTFIIRLPTDLSQYVRSNGS
ncbi:Signal transduction histidine kinase [Rhizobium sp. RU35A]|uniref:histidine kinase n=1 Tax=Rhizobium straminoryzae TaxID=1387186 RepID=A0A549T5V4_9HYPH|nr:MULTISPECIES: ATP-binding protein [Rhizobium]TRL37255.1 histidine kinase [Rhizobium straminoryzae]SIQ16279.1 Signal transduction histidine kinase [Rhizobium sp. RU35A]